MHDKVMALLQLPYGGFFFVYGFGGTSKTFLWKVLASSLHSKGHIVLIVSSSGISTTLLTLKMDNTFLAPMGGDFKQILLVIPKGTRATIVNACISSSHLWQHCTIVHLIKSMQLNQSNDINENKRIEWFSRWFLDVGDGEQYEFSSCDSVYKSTEDSDSFDNLYIMKFLNTITSSGLPPHKLVLKVGVSILLLRNIGQALGLCNGTRLCVTMLGQKVIKAVTLNRSRPNEKIKGVGIELSVSALPSLRLSWTYLFVIGSPFASSVQSVNLSCL
ncbi:hypothetical protein K1719_028242 [Acacia pycnantha]|nr:hypothetical protein K1719_028242 [Acacia pycnantha]